MKTFEATFTEEIGGTWTVRVFYGEFCLEKQNVPMGHRNEEMENMKIILRENC